MAEFDANQCLAFVDRSPAAVADHDKSDWLSLFAANGRVEDPVGSEPHFAGPPDSRAGDSRLGRFYETFIAPNTVRFSVDRDIVCGLHVMRDLTIEITMSQRVEVRVPVHLLYELTVEEGELKILRLAAHWELRPMLKQQMATGFAFLGVGGASGVRMLRQLGLTGTVGFTRALSSVGAEGKERVERFANCFNQSDVDAMGSLFAAAGVEIAFPLGERRLSIAQCAASDGQLRLSKLLSAGSTVSATLHYDHPDGPRDGVALFELDRSSLKIVALTFYWSE